MQDGKERRWLFSSLMVQTIQQSATVMGRKAKRKTRNAGTKQGSYSNLESSDATEIDFPSKLGVQ
jgi:hypothetical protein